MIRPISPHEVPATPVRSLSNRRTRVRVWKLRCSLFAVLAAALLLFPMLRTVKVVGESMDPTFKNGQIVLALRAYKKIAPLKIGDVVIAQPTLGESGGDEVIKRVFFIQNAQGNAPFPKFVVINGERIGTLALFPMEFIGKRVPKPGDIYLLGDNWQISVDSRDYGAVRNRIFLGRLSCTDR